MENMVKAGPFHVAPFLIIKDLGYDDNVRLGAEERSGDYTVTFGPGVRAVMPLGRAAALALYDEVDFVMFASQTDLNHFNNTARAKLHAYTNDLTWYADGGQRYYRERPNDEIDYRVRVTDTSGKLGVSYRPERRGRIDLYLGRLDHHYDSGVPEVPEGVDPNQAEEISENIATNLERIETAAGMEGRLKIRPRTSLLMDVVSGRIDFDRAVPTRDSKTFKTMAGLDFDPSGALRGFLKVGHRHLSPDEDTLDGYSGWIADCAVSARIAGRGDLRATYRRDTYFSTLGSNLFYLEDRGGLAYEHYINSRLSLEAGRQQAELDYPEPLFNPDTGLTEDRLDEIFNTTLTARYRMGPSLRIGLTVGHWERDSNFDGEDNDRNTIMTIFEYTP